MNEPVGYKMAGEGETSLLAITPELGTKADFSYFDNDSIFTVVRMVRSVGANVSTGRKSLI